MKQIYTYYQSKSRIHGRDALITAGVEIDLSFPRNPSRTRRNVL